MIQYRNRLMLIDREARRRLFSFSRILFSDRDPSYLYLQLSLSLRLSCIDEGHENFHEVLAIAYMSPAGNRLESQAVTAGHQDRRERKDLSIWIPWPFFESTAHSWLQQED
jgi:hypothetical protein